ncbi:hypothetical protein DFH08DRAFT_967933 [Mycena albidolilacea]|uniref:Uncharacterized protein n=1 Tax=Mycena albidolilacea TaxID=1033008 RepID=A0AAD6ZKI8_9AGAR|nr:hypothetical protein DFH08DRAFT_967933 [Mycena albidolilacea]
MVPKKEIVLGSSLLPQSRLSPVLLCPSFLFYTNMDSNSSNKDIISINRPLAHADNDINGMILAVAAEYPEAAQKFLVRTPAIMEKQAKAWDAKEKCVTKRKVNSESVSSAKVKSKGKKKKSNNSDVNEPPLSITYYIFIPKLPAVTAKKHGNALKATGNDDTIQKCLRACYALLVASWPLRTICTSDRTSLDLHDGSSITGFYVTGSSFRARPTLSPPSETLWCLRAILRAGYGGSRLSVPPYDATASDLLYTSDEQELSWPTQTMHLTYTHRHFTTGPLLWRNAWTTSPVAVSRQPLAQGGPCPCLTPIQRTRQDLS